MLEAPVTIDASGREALSQVRNRWRVPEEKLRKLERLLDGPLALDNAISPEAARVKGIESPVAGQADILVTPDMEAGNMLAKNLSFLSGAYAAGIVLGARVPIVLTSRADSIETRMASCAVAALYAHALRTSNPIPV